VWRCSDNKDIVTDANEVTRPIHDRMPVILDKVDNRAMADFR